MRTARLAGIGCILLFAMLGVGVLAQPAANPETQREIARIRTAIKAAKDNGNGLAVRLPKVQEDVDNLQRKVKEIAPPKALPPPQKSEQIVVGPPTQAGGPESVPMPKAKADQMEFRPPFAKDSDRQTNLSIICESGKVFILDLKAAEAPFQRAVTTIKSNAGKRDALLRGGKLDMGPATMASGDYDVKMLTLLAFDMGGGNFSIVPNFEMVRKSASPGQTLEQLQAPNSTFQKRLAALKPADNIIQFTVYPDSYDIFGEVRKMMVDRNYEVGWGPTSVGKPVLIGSGSGIAQ